jgi:Rap1a immunity proteins
MRFLQINILLIYIFFPGQGHAADNSYSELTGNQYLEMCNVSDKLCGIYFRGLLDGFTHANAITKFKLLMHKDEFKENSTLKIGLFSEYNLCLPDGVEDGQSFKILNKYLETNPEKSHKTVPLLYMSALVDAYPCN